jgi:hypothetical protein
MPDIAIPKLLSARDLAEATGLSPTAVSAARWCSAPRLPEIVDPVAEQRVRGAPPTTLDGQSTGPHRSTTPANRAHPAKAGAATPRVFASSATPRLADFRPLDARRTRTDRSYQRCLLISA